MTTTSMVLMAWLAGTVAHAGQPQYKLAVYLLDRANDGYVNCTLAETLASRMFAVIGISLEWTKGKPADESPAAAHHHRSGEKDANESPARFTGVCRTPRGFSHYCVHRSH